MKPKEHSHFIFSVVRIWKAALHRNSKWWDGLNVEFIPNKHTHIDLFDSIALCRYWRIKAFMRASSIPSSRTSGLVPALWVCHWFSLSVTVLLFSFCWLKNCLPHCVKRSLIFEILLVFNEVWEFFFFFFLFSINLAVEKVRFDNCLPVSVHLYSRERKKYMFNHVKMMHASSCNYCNYSNCNCDISLVVSNRWWQHPLDFSESVSTQTTYFAPHHFLSRCSSPGWPHSFGSQVRTVHSPGLAGRQPDPRSQRLGERIRLLRSERQLWMCANSEFRLLGECFCVCVFFPLPPRSDFTRRSVLWS